jgi:hypothetical protein
METPILKDGMKVRAPHSAKRDRFTPKKQYIVTQVLDRETTLFRTTDDNGEARFCLLKKCNHLRNGDWEIIQNSYPKRGLISERGVMIFAWIMLLLIAGAITYFAFV